MKIYSRITGDKMMNIFVIKKGKFNKTKRCRYKPDDIFRINI